MTIYFHNAQGVNTRVDFAPFKRAYKTLSEKLTPVVYELGFLKARVLLPLREKVSEGRMRGKQKTDSFVKSPHPP